MKRPKTDIVLENVEIHDAGAEGYGVGRHDGMVVFVPYSAPGDIVDVRVKQRKKNFAHGIIARFHQRSALRTEPFCEHFGLCGGCKWQHLGYQAQLEFKHKVVVDSFERIGGFDVGQIKPIIGSERLTNYRNKLEFTFSNRRWFVEAPPGADSPRHDSRALGFHMPGMFDRIIPVNECHLQADPSNKIRSVADRIGREMDLDFYDTREHRGYLRTLLIRTATEGQVMVIVVVAEDKPELLEAYLEQLMLAVPEISSLYYAINVKQNDALYDLEIVHHSGMLYLQEVMDGLRFRIGPKSFFQTNTDQALRLYRTAREFAGLDGTQKVFDLYCGTGTIACFLAKDAGFVLGVETIGDAVLDARENARMNNLQNVEFIAADLGKSAIKEVLDKYGKPDVVITDPPRAGMQPRVLEMLIQIGPERIVYVSCNPATQARDCAVLAKDYEVMAIQPVDMFPHTQHVESVAMLVRKSRS